MASGADLVRAYEADLETLDRAYPVRVSPARLDRMEAFQQRWQADLEAADNVARTPASRVDVALLQSYIRVQLHGVARQREAMARVRPLLAFADVIFDLEEDHRRHRRPAPDQTASRLDRLVSDVQSLTHATGGDGASAPPGAARLADNAGDAHLCANAVEELRDVLRKWFAFYDGFDPMATWWLRGPTTEADRVLGQYQERLREAASPGGSIAGTPVGEEAIRRQLEDDLVAYDPTELLAIARRELAQCRAEMERCAQEMGLGDDWRSALERVKEMHVPPGDQPELVYGLAREAQSFIADRDLVTVPPLCAETWRAEMMPPERQLVAPFFLGGEVVRISYPSDTMSIGQRLMSMRGNGIYLTRSIVFHELIPGHYLQQFMTARHNAHRRLFRTPYWSEGNAFYWELLLWDLGFCRTPEERMGMLFWRAHRSARVIYTLGYHTGRMTTEQCVDFLVRELGHEADTAKGEVRRLFDPHYGPLYQCAYLIGALQFQALNREFVQTGTLSARAFHDAILRQGPILPPILRSLLRGEAPPTHPTWRFYDEIAAAADGERPADPLD